MNLTFYNMIRPQTITQRALTRLLRYWNSRHKVFGDDYILPLTLYGMYHKEMRYFVHIICTQTF